MSITRDIASHDNAVAYGGLIDAIGGVATIVLVICGLVGIAPPMMVAIATIVFGVALLIQGGAMLSEYTQVVFPGGVRTASVEQMGGNSLALVFLVGAGGIVLGVLSLLGISCGSPDAGRRDRLWHRSVAEQQRRMAPLCAATRLRPDGGRRVGQSQHVGAEMLASEMASGSAGIQALAGLAAIVLGILALAGNTADLTLNLVALLALGSTIVLTGSTLSATVLSFMRT